MNQTNNYQFLIAKLNAFIRKYYLNQLLRGALILCISVLAFFLMATVSEYYIYWPSWMRYTLLSIFVLGGVAALVRYIIFPLLHLSKMGKTITHHQAATIIGKHFPEVSDKLLNILQLHEGLHDTQSLALIEASINQKAQQLTVVPMTQAIRLSKNKKYLPYLLPLLLIGMFIVLASPNLFKDASVRLLQPGKTFEPPAPFQFYLEPKNGEAILNSDYTIKAWTRGSMLPKELWVVLDNEKVPMKLLQKDTFTYVFKNVTNALQFKLYGAGFYSQNYHVGVAQKPVLRAFKVQLNYPAYTGRKAEMRNSLSDLTLPVGTKVSWLLNADYTDVAYMKYGGSAPIPMIATGKNFMFAASAMNDTAYAIQLINKRSQLQENMQYKISVIPDQLPTLQVQEYKDTVSGKYVLLLGTAGDDYSISKVNFHFQIQNNQGATLRSGVKVLSNGGGPVTLFQNQFDIASLNLQPGQKVNYYVEAWDNDAVHGSKSVRSMVYSFAMYRYNQLDSVMLENAQQIASGLSNSAQQSKQLTEEFKDMQSKMLDGQPMDWESENALMKLGEQQESVKNLLEKSKQKLEEQMKQAEQKNLSQDLKDKQEEIKKQMDNLLNKELQDMIKKIQEMLANKNKENNLNQLQQLEMQNKLFNMDMERLNELVKKLELQMRMEDAAAKAEKMAAEQQSIKQNTEQESKQNDQLNKEQNDLAKKLDDFMKKDMKDMEELNKQMQQQQNMDEMKQEGNDAQQQMQNSKQELGKSNNSKASQSQSKAAQNLQQMADMMKQAAGGMDMQQIEIDIKATRQILTNLIRLSFDEEKLMNTVAKTGISDKGYLANMQEQKRLHNNSKMIRDSLFVLSKRIFKLAANVNKETTELENNMRLASKALEDRRVPEAGNRQQYVMTHTNNLALMLNELLSNLMQAQAQGQQPGNGSCSNPGSNPNGKKPGQGAGMQLSDIITRQQQLGQGMGKGKGQGNSQGQGDQNGQQGNQGKDGSNRSNGAEGGEYGSAEQLARTAAQQAAIRKQLQDLNQILNGNGMGDIAKELRDVQKQMDKNETDLVNKRITGDLLLRQQDILTRLLKAEKAVREQEQDDKRSSRSAADVPRSVPAEIQKMLQERQQMLEVYKTIPPQLKPYYKQMVERYYKNLVL